MASYLSEDEVRSGLREAEYRRRAEKEYESDQSDQSDDEEDRKIKMQLEKFKRNMTKIMPFLFVTLGKMFAQRGSFLFIYLFIYFISFHFLHFEFFFFSKNYNSSRSFNGTLKHSIKRILDCKYNYKKSKKEEVKSHK